MKLPAPFVRHPVALVWICLCLLLVAAGCSRSHPAVRPASSLSAADRAVLDQYEQIRAALADDNLRDARVAAGTLAIKLKPADDTTPASPICTQAAAVASAPALDRARQLFKLLSAKVIPLADGVEGFYVMTCNMPSCGDWVQQKAEVSNPYMGKAMRDYGDVKK